MPTTLEETSTITAKGQTTIPKVVRQILGIDTGGKIAFRIEDGRVTVHNPDAEHHDAELAAFLHLIEKDISSGGSVRDMPPALARTLRRILKQVPVKLDKALDGDVVL